MNFDAAMKQLMKPEKSMNPGPTCELESDTCSEWVGDRERRKREAFERWMDAIERRLTAQEEEDAARKEYSAADDAHSRAAKSPTDQGSATRR